MPLVPETESSDRVTLLDEKGCLVLDNGMVERYQCMCSMAVARLECRRVRLQKCGSTKPYTSSELIDTCGQGIRDESREPRSLVLAEKLL